ncbi:MAG: PhzF family phenazine biosynthesis protein [Bacteroidota bacterium]
MIKPLRLFQVDAFTNQLFRGNPAAVCISEHWLEATIMQAIAAENNLSETAFAVKKTTDQYETRWFTPTTEVVLCGHATLATAHILFQHYETNAQQIHFVTQKAGDLSVNREEAYLWLDFPTDTPQATTLPDVLKEAFTTPPLEVWKGKEDYLLVLSSQKAVEEFQPDFKQIAKVKARGIIITAPGERVDFVSRFFAPQVGVDEDPVTGSAHTLLIPYWAKRLKKNSLQAKQISARGGDLQCIYAEDRVKIGGQAITYLEGIIHL